MIIKGRRERLLKQIGFKSPFEVWKCRSSLNFQWQIIPEFWSIIWEALIETNFRFMNWRAVKKTLRNIFSVLPHLVLATDVYKDKNGAKYSGSPVVMYLCTNTRDLKMICCLTRSQWRYFKVGAIRVNLESPKILEPCDMMTVKPRH